jgi:hypothetical protein
MEEKKTLDIIVRDPVIDLMKDLGSIKDTFKASEVDITIHNVEVEDLPTSEDLGIEWTFRTKEIKGKILLWLRKSRTTCQPYIVNIWSKPLT